MSADRDRACRRGHRPSAARTSTRDDGKDGVPRSPVRPRARLGVLPGRPRRPRGVGLPAKARERAARRRRSTERLPGKSAGLRHGRPDAAGTRHTRAAPPLPAPASSRTRRSGASSSASPAPAPTSPGSPHAPNVTATPRSSTGRKSAPRGATPHAAACSSRERDPQAVKHRGLTYFLCDMRAPGVEVRPLRQMTGNAEFNEVYFSDVRLSDELRVGPLGGGWGVRSRP